MCARKKKYSPQVLNLIERIEDQSQSSDKKKAASTELEEPVEHPISGVGEVREPRSCHRFVPLRFQ
jgi:hypothetical protein